MDTWSRLLKKLALRIHSKKSRFLSRHPRRRVRPSTYCELLEDRLLLSAMVATNRSDYAPGSTAIITASGFAIGEKVQVQVVNADGTDAGAAAHQAWDVTAGPNGSIQTTWYVGSSEHGKTLDVIVTGLVSQETATSTFTDSADVGTVTIGPQVGTATYGTSNSVSYLVTVNRNASSDGEAFTADLSVTGGLPAGVTAAFGTNSLNFAADVASMQTIVTLTTSTT